MIQFIWPYFRRKGNLVVFYEQILGHEYNTSYMTFVGTINIKVISKLWQLPLKSETKKIELNLPLDMSSTSKQSLSKMGIKNKDLGLTSLKILYVLSTKIIKKKKKKLVRLRVSKGA